MDVNSIMSILVFTGSVLSVSTSIISIIMASDVIDRACRIKKRNKLNTKKKVEMGRTPKSKNNLMQKSDAMQYVKRESTLRKIRKRRDRIRFIAIKLKRN